MDRSQTEIRNLKHQNGLILDDLKKAKAIIDELQNQLKNVQLKNEQDNVILTETIREVPINEKKINEKKIIKEEIIKEELAQPKEENLMKIVYRSIVEEKEEEEEEEKEKEKEKEKEDAEKEEEMIKEEEKLKSISVGRYKEEIFDFGDVVKKYQKQ